MVDEPSGGFDEELSGALSAALRSRIVALAAQAIGRMPVNQVPGPLRRAASFTPAKRLRLAGNQIFAALDDPDFRQRVGVQVTASAPKLAAALEAGPPFAEADLADIAALAYIARPAGWTEVVLAADDRTAADGQSVPDLSATVARLSEKLDTARAETKQMRERMRGQVEELKADNTQLRRKLGEARSSLRSAESAASAAGELAEAGRRQVDVAHRDADAEGRRLRARIADLETQLTAARRATRTDRDAENARLRLLLDTVAAAVDGLRRELAVPSTGSLPAETVAAVDPATPGAFDIGAARSNDDPALLRMLLDLPRLHLIVDGYNVSKAAWPVLTLEQQRQRLVSQLAGVVAGRRVEATVAFDGADLPGAPAMTSPRGIRVMFSRADSIADDLIRELVEAEPRGRPIVVVTSDAELAESVSSRGARTVASAALVGLLSG